MGNFDHSAVPEYVNVVGAAFEKREVAVHHTENSTKDADVHADDAQAWGSLGVGGLVQMLAVRVSN